MRGECGNNPEIVDAIRHLAGEEINQKNCNNQV